MKKLANILAGLEAARRDGRLHHAYALAGPETAHKTKVVEEFAAAFATEGGRGNALARIQNGMHPDFVRLVPTNDLLNVEEMRTLPKALAYPPLELSRRVVLLERAQTLNGQAANAILKILEEPPPHTMFFLQCREPSELLPTIVSRCQVLRFPPLGEEELRKELGDAANLSAALVYSEGSRARADHFLALEGAESTQREAAEHLISLWEASPRVPSSAVQWVEGLEDDALAQIAVDTWELVLRDLAFAASGAPANALRLPVYHGRLAKLGQAGREALVAEAASKSAALNRFRVHRDFNGNARLNFAALLAELQMFSVGKRPASG